jgi:hypothetical protein
MRVVAAVLAILAILAIGIGSRLEARAIVPEPSPIASPLPSPESRATGPSATGAPLKEIGRIRVSTPLCKALVGTAARAVAIETENDRRLAIAETTLQTTDLDRNELVKYQGVREITKQYVDLRTSALAGKQLMRDFREQAKTAATVEQRESLKIFADALDGALRRQRVLADDMGRLVAYLDAHPPISKEDHDALVFNALLTQSDLRLSRQIFDPRNDGPLAVVPDSLSTTAKNAGIEIARRAEPIGNDEDAAAARIDPAFSGC